MSNTPQTAQFQQAIQAAALANTREGIAVIDHAGRILSINAALSRMSGISETDAPNQPFAALFLHGNIDQTGPQDTFVRFLQSVKWRLEQISALEPQSYYTHLAYAPLACILVDDTSHILFANSHAHQLAGYSPDTLTGQPLAVLIPAGNRADHPQQVHQFQSKSQAQRMGEGRKLSMSRRDGSALSVEVGLINHDLQGRRVTLAWIRDENDLPWDIIRCTSFGAMLMEPVNHGVLRLRSTNNQALPVQVSISLVREGPYTNQFAVASVTDFSLLYFKALEITKKHELLTRVQQTMQDGLVHIDLSGRIVEANSRAQAILGRSLTNMMGEPFLQYLKTPLNDQQAWLPSLLGGGLQGLYSKDPELFWLRLWALPQPIIISNECQRVFFANAMAEQLLGYERSEMLGLPMGDLLDDGYQSVMHEILDEHLLHNASNVTDLPELVWKNHARNALIVPPLMLCTLQTELMPLVAFILNEVTDPKVKQLLAHSTHELKLIRADAQEIPAAFTGTAIRNSLGQVTGSVITFKDISDLSAMKERKQMLQQTTSQAKLATLGEMATGIMHEVNQPLTYISAVLQSIRRHMRQDKPLEPERTQEMLQESLRQVGRITRIMNHLRTFGRADAMELIEPAYWPEVLDNTLILLGKKLANANIQLRQEIAENLPRVIGNANSFEQILINFFQNAMHALEGRADKEIALSMQPVRDSADHEWVEIRFADNGSGMPEAVRTKCFEPFYTTKPIGQGTGVGLSTVHGIVHKYNGHITVTSAPEQGTTFIMNFPVSVTHE